MQESDEEIKKKVGGEEGEEEGPEDHFDLSGLKMNREGERRKDLTHALFRGQSLCSSNP